MRHPKRRITAPVLLAGTAVLLASCGSDNKQDSLQPHGEAASKIKDLFVPILGVAIVIGILVLLATVYAAVRFRHREGQPDNPKQVHGNTPLEIGWTIVPALILAVVAVPTVSTIWDLAGRPTGPHVLKVDVTGKQWWWEFQLPKQPLVPQAKTAKYDSKNPKAGNSGLVTTSTELHIPVGTKVDISLHAYDVIHSFWVPALSGKKDVMPARTNHLTIEADKPGTYLGACAEYCGLSHADMRFRVIAEPMDQWKQWLADISGPPAGDYGTKDKPTDVYTLTNKTYGCTGCHVFNDAQADNYGPNLTHLRSRSTFAGGTMKLNAENLKAWIMNAPSKVAMESKDCRLPPPATCTGMPSFTKNTPKGMKTMTSEDADTIVNFLLGEK
ncbi:MAG: cytochrome c oxidase subunit II [Acidimicrobiia bacterium]